MYSYAISYDLIGPNRDYDKIHTAIKELGSWAFINESLWIVKSSLTSVNIRDRLESAIDKNDKLIVMKLTGEAAWLNLSQEVNEWLKKNL